MEIIIGFVLGGLFVTATYTIFRKYVFKKETMGTLQVDKSDPIDGPHLFLANCVHPNIIAKEKYVTFKVEVTNYLSQE